MGDTSNAYQTFLEVLLNLVQILIVIVAWIAHFCFFRFVIRPRNFIIYSRVTFFAVSLGMMIMTFTSLLGFCETLFSGHLIETMEINQRARRQFWLYIHSYGEFMVVAFEVLAALERLTCIFRPKFHKSTKFSSLFIFFVFMLQILAILYIYSLRLSNNPIWLASALITANLMEVLNFAMLLILFFFSRHFYIKTRGTRSLSFRFQVSGTFSWSKCMLVPALFSTAFKFFIFFYVWMNFLGVFSDALMPYYYNFLNLVINLYCAIYPNLVMFNHSKIRRTIRAAFPFLRKAKISDCPKIFALDGIVMNQPQTLEEYFDNLKTQWQ